MSTCPLRYVSGRNVVALQELNTINMGKRTAKVPLALISPSEPVYGTRSKQQTSISSPYEGKENTPVRNSRRGTHKDEQQKETSRSSNESQQRITLQKRTRSTDLSSRPGLRGHGKASRREDSFAGSESCTPVRGKKEDLLPADNTIAKNVQVMGTADACSKARIQNGAAVGIAVECEPVACCSLANTVSAELAEVAGSQTLVGPTIQSASEESEERLRSREQRAPTKTYRRRASREGTAPRVPNRPEQPPSRDQNHGLKWEDVCKSDELQAIIVRSTDSLQNAYDKLFRQYQNLKTRQLAEAAEAFDEQSKRINVFSTAADDLLRNLRATNSSCEHQQQLINRSRAIEAAYIECQNDLAIERARNLELRQHLENAELRGSKLMHDLLGNTTQLTISSCGKSEIMFSHDQSGYEFKLEQNKLSEEVGGKDALLYNVISPGTILHIAPEWMQLEIVFDMTQALVFFRRMAVFLRGGVSM